jgi:hypothetical protein
MVLREDYDEVDALPSSFRSECSRWGLTISERGRPIPTPWHFKGFCFLETAREYLFERLMGNSDPCVGNAGKDEFGILIEADTNLPSLTVILDRIREEIIKELVEFSQPRRSPRLPKLAST